MATAEEIVRRQFDAYGARDLEGFVGFFADDATCLRFPAEVTARSRAELRESRRAAFAAAPERTWEIPASLAVGRYVVIHERLRSVESGALTEFLVVYEVDGERIRTMLTIPL